LLPLVNCSDVALGAKNVGWFENTKLPVPVSSVTVAAKFALDGVVTNVSTPDARVIAAHEVRFAGTPVRSPHALLAVALSVLPARLKPVPRVIAAGELMEVGQPSSRPTVGVTGRTTRGPLAGFWLNI
jgi:hypothetical protein